MFGGIGRRQTNCTCPPRTWVCHQVDASGIYSNCSKARMKRFRGSGKAAGCSIHGTSRLHAALGRTGKLTALEYRPHPSALQRPRKVGRYQDKSSRRNGARRRQRRPVRSDVHDPYCRSKPGFSVCARESLLQRPFL